MSRCDDQVQRLARAVIEFAAPPDSEGAEKVIFTRDFQLSGSPLGWTVSLSGFISGRLTNIFDSSTTHTEAGVNADGDILVGALSTGIEIYYHETLVNRNGGCGQLEMNVDHIDVALAVYFCRKKWPTNIASIPEE